MVENNSVQRTLKLGYLNRLFIIFTKYRKHRKPYWQTFMYKPMHPNGKLLRNEGGISNAWAAVTTARWQRHRRPYRTPPNPLTLPSPSFIPSHLPQIPSDHKQIHLLIFIFDSLKVEDILTFIILWYFYCLFQLSSLLPSEYSHCERGMLWRKWPPQIYMLSPFHEGSERKPEW